MLKSHSSPHSQSNTASGLPRSSSLTFLSNRLCASDEKHVQVKDSSESNTPSHSFHFSCGNVCYVRVWENCGQSSQGELHSLVNKEHHHILEAYMFTLPTQSTHLCPIRFVFGDKMTVTRLPRWLCGCLRVSGVPLHSKESSLAENWKTFSIHFVWLEPSKMS